MRGAGRGVGPASAGGGASLGCAARARRAAEARRARPTAGLSCHAVSLPVPPAFLFQPAPHPPGRIVRLHASARAFCGHVRTMMAGEPRDGRTGTRSFHHFCPGQYSDASDPRSVRAVYRCRATLNAGYKHFLRGRDFAKLHISGRSFLRRQVKHVCTARGELRSRDTLARHTSHTSRSQSPKSCAAGRVLVLCYECRERRRLATPGRCSRCAAS